MNPADRLGQAAAYALGALDTGEVPGFETELGRSAELRTEVASLRAAARVLAEALPVRTPPPGLRRRILSDAARSRPVPAAVSGTAARSRVPAVAHGRWAVLAPWLALAAAVAGITVLQRRVIDDRATRVTLVAVTDSMRAALAARDSVIASLLGPDVVVAKLTATGQAPSARLYWDRATNRVILATYTLPPAPAGRTYQLWGIAGLDARPVSLGTFNTGANGEGRLVTTLPAGATMQFGAITVEPAPGSSRPTMAPFLSGQLAQ
jgi:anti-sigma-K factor RskA